MPRLIDHARRKAELAEAVWRVVSSRGVAAVSVRTVAAEAGVAVGSLRHLFPSRAELLEFSTQLMIERVTARLRAEPPVPDPQERAVSTLLHLLPLDAERRAEMEVNVAVVAETPALPALAGIRDEATRQLLALCEALVAPLVPPQDAGARTRAARRLHACVDGLALHLLVQRPDAETGWAVTVLREEVAAIARG